MALLGILADVHGNLAALTSALAVLDRAGASGLACLGDLVGYHPDGDACVRILVERGAVSIAGNHDLIAAGALGPSRCGRKARHALAQAARDIAPATARTLVALPRARLLAGSVACIHGGVDDVCEYMTSADLIAANVPRLLRLFPKARACLFGHTHVRALYVAHGGEVRREHHGRTVLLARDGAVVFVNPGSVDAARRRGNTAELALLDSERLELTFLDARYDDRASERRARAAGYRRPHPWVERVQAVIARVAP
jgi:predicted phosphodiesterase